MVRTSHYIIVCVRFFPGTPEYLPILYVDRLKILNKKAEVGSVSILSPSSPLPLLLLSLSNSLSLLPSPSLSPSLSSPSISLSLPPSFPLSFPLSFSLSLSLPLSLSLSLSSHSVCILTTLVCLCVSPTHLSLSVSSDSGSPSITHSNHSRH